MIWADTVTESLDVAMRHLDSSWSRFPTAFTGLNGKHKELTRDIANLVVELTAARGLFPEDAPGKAKKEIKRTARRTRSS